MKLGFIYLPLAALLYNNSALCSNIEFEYQELNQAIQRSLQEFNEEKLNQAIKLSLEENDYQLALSLHSQINEKTDEYKKNNSNLEEEINDNDLLILTNIFQKLNKKYNDRLEYLEVLYFEDTLLLPNLKNLFVYDENEEDLAAQLGLTIQGLKTLKKSTDERLLKMKALAEEQRILEPKDQKDKIIQKFKKETNCSQSFAAKAYKKFIGED